LSGESKAQEGEGALVERAQAGDIKAFEEILTRYEDQIYRFGFRMCGHIEDAREVLQDTFLAALRNIGGYRGEGQFVNWLYKIASSACLKKRRLKVDEPKHKLSLDQEGRDNGASLGAALPSDTPDPEEEAQRAQVRELLQEALLTLPEHYRAVVVLRDFEHRSTEEVADMLGLKISATKVRLHRARLMLRERLQGVLGAFGGLG
jgi:RNA polymerase sigma-70 factor, ECF subfamily